MSKRPCDHADRRPRPSECHLCKLFVTRPEYHALWAEDAWYGRLEGFKDKPRVALGAPRKK